jgi:hypothetical protein
LRCSPAARVADIVIDIIGGEEAAIPIAVVPFSWRGAGEAPVDMGRHHLEQSAAIRAIQCAAAR